jgi:hypothetical protein
MTGSHEMQLRNTVTTSDEMMIKERHEIANRGERARQRLAGISVVTSFRCVAAPHRAIDESAWTRIQPSAWAREGQAFPCQHSQFFVPHSHAICDGAAVKLNLPETLQPSPLPVGACRVECYRRWGHIDSVQNPVGCSIIQRS